MKRGTEVGRAYVGVEINGDGMNEDIVDEVDKAGPGIERAGKDHGERYGDEFEGGFFSRIREGFRKGLAQEMEKRADKDGHSTGNKLGGGIVAGLKDRLDGAGFGPLRERLSGDIDAISERMDVLRGKLERARSPQSIDRLTASLKESRAEATRLIGQMRTLAAQEVRELSRGVSGNRGGGGRGRDNDTIGDTIGGLLGAGSRSNVLNFFGRSLGNIINLTEKARKTATGLFSAFSKGFSEAGEGATFLQKVMSGFGGSGQAIGGGAAKAFSSIAASGPAAAAAIIVVIGAMSALVSVAGALLAIITALVATVASALVGAMAVGGAAVLGVVAAAGLLTAAFMSMDDAQKRMLKDSFQPLKAEMVGLGQIMIQQMVPAFGVWSANLQRALALAAPLAEGMGAAFAKAGTILTASFSGPGFQALAQSLGVYLPSIITRLSMALGSFLNGSAAIFAALMPYVNRFAFYLAQVADRFSRWANSAEGQNSIVDFTDRALASLRSLWNFVREFTGYIFDVLFSPEAQGAGNGMFDGLARSFEKFRKNFAKAQADGSLQKWFDDAIEFGGRALDVFDALADVIGDLYNSGVLDAVGYGFEGLAKGIQIATVQLGPMVDLLGKAGGLLKYTAPLLGLFGGGGGGGGGGPTGAFNPFGKITDMFKGAQKGLSQMFKGSSISDLLGKGNSALAGTAAEWKNPYEKYAQSLMDSGPSIAKQVRDAFKQIAKQINAAVREAARAETGEASRSALQSVIESVKASAEQAVSTARSSLNSAAQSLSSASTQGEANRALAQVRAAQKALSAALAGQKRTAALSKLLQKQKGFNYDRVAILARGGTSSKATLTEYAMARERIATKIEAANQKLADAIAMRSQYKDQVTESIKAFGSLLTAQAQTIDGVEQALTAGDITANLQDRLTKIKAFNDNLRILLAQGLSKDAYKQLVDAGVEGGSASAAALVAGGQGAVQQVNSLTQQISDIAGSMGAAASSQLYDAGVDAAKGLVDGLNSMAAQLDSAAARLGDSIAKAVKRALGIKSPSTVMRDMMGYVGDGAVLGLDDQGPKVESAASRFADRIAVSPEAAAYANRNAESKVSGNSDDPRIRDLHVHTPTEDPAAVAQEVLNEVVGRLP